MDKTWDAIIIGGGHNGLACAAYLAKAGADVLVLEQEAKEGGASVTSETWPGYQVSSAAYVASLMPQQVVDELDLVKHGYKVRVLDPDYWVPYPDGSSLTLWNDPVRTAESIRKLCPGDAERFIEFDRYFQRVANLMRDLLFLIPPNLSLGEIPGALRVAAKLRHWSKKDIAEVVRLFTVSGADFLDEWFEDERVKGALGTQTILGAWCGPMSPGSAYVLLHHWIGQVDGMEGAWGWVSGGMGAVSDAISASAQARGATLRLGAPVRRVVIEGERARGVELEDGEIILAHRVISSAHPITTYLDLIGEENLDEEVIQNVKRYKTRSGTVKVNIGMRELPRPTAWKGDIPGDPHSGIFAISPSLEYLERAWDDAKYGRASREPYLEGVFPTAFEPELAPDGRHIGLFYTQFGPYELSEGSWDQERGAYGDRIVQIMEDYCPGFKDSVEHIEVMAPVDLEERFGLIGGNIMQGEMTVNQMFSFRPIPDYGDYRSPVEGFYLCGSGTHPGGGVSGIPARNCSQVVLKDKRRARFRFWKK
ncbi:MAG: amine oxidase [Spirochaeta sp.]|nr:amine oxidase [Spirochaeta sp.]RPG08113.1 MAG: NAD(P)/FAD-dependent oxidoreductase [Proteobacteria bacterium TMED72]